MISCIFIKSDMPVGRGGGGRDRPDDGLYNRLSKGRSGTTTEDAKLTDLALIEIFYN